MTNYMQYIQPHLGKTEHVSALERFEIGIMRPDVLRDILRETEDIKDVAKQQEIALDRMIRDLPNNIRVQFNDTFREVTIKDANEKILVSGRGLGPEGALYSAYIKYWKYVKEEVPGKVSAGAKGLPKRKAPASKKKVVL